MITASLPARHTNSPDGSAVPASRGWKRELAEAIDRPEELLRALDLDPATCSPEAAGRFRTRVPWSFVRRMRRGDPNDPLLRQVLAIADELQDTPGFVADPLAEKDANVVPGLLHKYRGRALLVTTGACAVHCRYCFRREFPYDAQVADSPRWTPALAAIAADPTIEEVILSGGDPLSLSDSRLAEITDALRRMEHVRRLRIHTRTAVVLPARIDDGFVAWLHSLPWPVTMVVHVNHPQEIDAEVRAALARVRGTGAHLLNQSVLLAGVNDDADTLAGLSDTLFDAGVLPYYLHLLDRVRGASHFEVDEARALELIANLTARLPGYLVPRLAREEPGAASKTVIAPP
jgi:EF-P beta-lysylation protein EpmB